jgi:hypothetical protein
VAYPDLINGSFEAIGSLLVWLNIRQLYRDKVVRGVHIAPVMFWTAWGYWNIYYYPHLNQWLSFAGGISVVLANSVWVGQMLYYRKERE